MIDINCFQVHTFQLHIYIIISFWHGSFSLALLTNKWIQIYLCIVYVCACMFKLFEKKKIWTFVPFSILLLMRHLYICSFGGLFWYICDYLYRKKVFFFVEQIQHNEFRQFLLNFLNFCFLVAYEYLCTIYSV